MPIESAAVEEYLGIADSAPDSYSKGLAYENLVVYLFEQTPGCLVEHGVMNEFVTEQIDVAVGNAGSAEGLGILPNVILIECKNCTKPVDSKTVGYFLNILAGRGVALGILIAANGIAGQEDGMHAASLGLAAAPRGVKVIVITTEDIRALTSTSDFVELLTRRFLRAAGSGTIGLP